MAADWTDALLAGLDPRRVVVVSDRYPPDAAGGAELSLHLLLREAPLRDQVLVVTFDALLDGPERYALDGVEVLALPSPAAWPLHRLSQAEVERMKTRRFGLKWTGFLREAMWGALIGPRAHGPALILRLARAAPPGGVRMAHVTVREGRSPIELGAILDRVRPQVVHADNARAIMVAAVALERRALPLVALVRDHRFTSRRFDQTFLATGEAPDGWAARLADRCAVTALAFRQEMLRRAQSVLVMSGYMERMVGGVVPQQRLRRAPLVPIAAPAAPPPPRAEDGRFRILVVGSLTANKGQLHLLNGLERLLSAIPDATIDFVGRGPAHSEINRLIARRGAQGRVKVHGRVAPSELDRHYADCDVVALPTLWTEPFGRVPLEAAAHARPVVAYASGGLAETVIDGVTGRLVATGDLDAMIAALAGLAADPALRARMGLAGVEQARAHAAPRLAGELARIWDEAAESGEGAREAEPRRAANA